MVADAKSTLLDYLGRARRAMVFKTEGLSEYDVRRAWRISKLITNAPS